MESHDRLIPILRDAVEIVKMILFKELKDDLRPRYADREAVFTARLAAALVNELFGTRNEDEAFLTFASEHQTIIEEELRLVGTRHSGLRIPLTDALRVQFLCDSREGRENESVLFRARSLGVLIVERDVPLPRNFLGLVRRLGAVSGVVIPPFISEESTEV